MAKIKNSWFRAYKFTPSKIHSDWAIGISSWGKIKDCITDAFIPTFSTIFWNRSFGNKCLMLDTYKDIVKKKEPEMLKKLEELQLPLDINFS